MKTMPNTEATHAACAINREMVERAWKGFMRQQTGWLAIPENEWDSEWDRICRKYISANI